MTITDYEKYDACGLRELLIHGSVSEQELYDCAVARTEQCNPALNFLAARFDRTRGDAANTPTQAPFRGIPFLIKEGAGLRGTSASYASRLLAGVTSDGDSELVQRIKRSGVTIIGSTNVPELYNATTTESQFYGPARNPWDPTRSVGGSSGGAACAVAAGVVPMAQGSDGAGSIRVPAHCCGVFGFIPSRGRNPCGPGGFGGTFGILRQHVLTRSVRDSAAMLDELQGPEPGAWFRTESPAGRFADMLKADSPRLRIAFSTQSPSGRPLDPECASAVVKTARLLADQGHVVEESEPTYDWDKFERGFGICWAYNYLVIEELAHTAGRRVTPDLLERSTWLMLEYGRALSARDVYDATAELHELCLGVEAYFQKWDVFMSPVCLSPAPKLKAIDANAANLSSYPEWVTKFISEFAAFTPIFNITGQPAMSVPLHQSAMNLPIGVHFAGRFGAEATLLQLAAQLEQAMPWKERRPPLG